MGNYEQIERNKETLVLEDEVSLSFYSQLFQKMKHLHSTGGVKHTLNVPRIIRRHDCTVIQKTPAGK